MPTLYITFNDCKIVHFEGKCKLSDCLKVHYEGQCKFRDCQSSVFLENELSSRFNSPTKYGMISAITILKHIFRPFSSLFVKL